MAVHPRACGEHRSAGSSAGKSGGSSPRLRGTRPVRLEKVTHAGSSPRLRGTPGRLRFLRPLVRFIPAPAGNTAPLAGNLHGGGGSSPRLRGTHRLQLLDHDHLRFIPAPAGNTCCPFRPPAADAVHPRACGEHIGSSSSITITCGSSPRLRGTHAALSGRPLPTRFIPAPAGNTRSQPAACRPFRFIPAPAGNTAPVPCFVQACPVHPRACGEHSAWLREDRVETGSSPRLRGTLVGAHPISVGWRFIPAPAGNTSSNNSRIIISTVHPRACGEHILKQFPDNHFDGSSPRLRGTLRHLHYCRRGSVHPRACGNTARAPQPLFCGPVHPRACGEHSGRSRSRTGIAGSSPRLRGTRPSRPALTAFSGSSRACGEHSRCCASLLAMTRFIPAPAGNTAESRCRRLALAVHPRACGEHG